ncbi:MAG: hypothetical protein JST68_00465 [Bacteroidetes bacterium]|nr:hypothetical protein [Bacteroidota bacterium]
MEELFCVLERMKNDHRIAPAHVSLFLALFWIKTEQGAADLFPINREDLMQRAKLLDRGRYYRCLRDLAGAGYIIYEPAFNPRKSSKVRLGDLFDQ